MERSESLVSVVIPVFNRKELVHIMVESIMEQTYPNWELLLVDDGSAGDTLEMIHGFAVVDKRIKVYNRNRLPKGAPTCRNIGLKHAIGKYIIFFDSDDWIPDHSLEQRVDFMEKNQYLDFAVFPAMSFTDEIVKGKYKKFYAGVQIGNNDLKHLIDCNLPFLVVTNIYKVTSLMKKNILWDEYLLSLQDADFNIQNLNKANEYMYATNARIDYYIRIVPQSNSISQSLHKASHCTSHLYFVKKIFKELPTDSRQKNKWAIRRRIVFIYTLIHGESKEYQAGLKKIVQMYDSAFYPVFCISANFYSFLKKIHFSNSIYWAFPYYSLYGKFYNLRYRMKIDNLLKKKMIRK